MFHLDLDGGKMLLYILAIYFLPLILLLVTIASFAFIRGMREPKWFYAIPVILLVLTLVSFMFSLRMIS
jgi:hypothetical protein